MLDTFKAQLKAKSKAAGANLSAKRIDAIADRLEKKFPDLKEDADHIAKIDDLYDEQDFKDFAAADDFQRAKDAKEKKDKAEKDKEDKTEKVESKTDDDMPAWAKSLIEQGKELAAKLGGLEKEKALGSIKQKAAEKLKEVPERFWSKLPLPEKEEDIETFVADVQTDYTAFKQELVNQGFSQVTPPYSSSSGGKTKEATKEEIKAITDKIKII